MNRCYSLAYDVPGPTHVLVRIFGHGAFFGALTLRNDERKCFEALFYDPANLVRHRLRAGERVEGPTFGYRVEIDSFVCVEPETVCEYTPRVEPA